MARVHLKDIAEASSVSVSLVSRILRGEMGNASAAREVQKRVQDAARQLGYTPDRRARSLRTGKNDLVAVIMPVAGNFATSVGPEILRGLMEGSRGSQYDFIYRHFDSQEEELQALQYTCDMHIDGLLYVPSSYIPITEEIQSLFQRLRENGVKLMFCMEKYEIEGAYYVDVDDVAGARMAAEYLIRAGAKEITYLHYLIQRRADEFRRVCREAGVALHVYECTAFSAEMGERAMQDILKTKTPAFIAAACDVMATGVQRACKEAGVRPLLVGFDGLPFRRLLEAPFPTVEQPVYEAGMLAMRNLLALLAGKQITSVTLSPIFREER